MSNRAPFMPTRAKLSRVEAIEEMSEHHDKLLKLVVRDLSNTVDHMNYLGSILQATVNVLGQGAVNEELERMKRVQNSMSAPPPGPSVADEAIAAEQAIEAQEKRAELVASQSEPAGAQGVDANGSPVEPDANPTEN